eukprot:s1483_g2.t1
MVIGNERHATTIESHVTSPLRSAAREFLSGARFSERGVTSDACHGGCSNFPAQLKDRGTLGTETSRKVKIFEKGSARNVMPSTEGWFGLGDLAAYGEFMGRSEGGRFLPKDLTTLEGLNATYATKDWAWLEILLGITIGFAQVPESVAFAFLAHVRPHVALHAAWVMGLFCSLLGGRPGMVNGATGAFAAIIATFLPVPSAVAAMSIGSDKNEALLKAFGLRPDDGEVDDSYWADHYA